MRRPALLLIGLLFASTGTAVNVAHAAGVAGQVTHLSGVLVAKRADGSSKLFSVKSEILEGDTLTTEQETYARIKFTDGSEVVLRPGSQLKISSFSFSQDQPATDNVILDMLRGGMRSVTGLIGKRSRDKVLVNAPNATVGIRGTHFGALICQSDCGGIPTSSGKPPENGLHLDVTDGAIVVRNQAGEQQIASGQFGFVRTATTAPTLVPPQQGVPVTMPSSIARNNSDGRGGLGKDKGDECAVPH